MKITVILDTEKRCPHCDRAMVQVGSEWKCPTFLLYDTFLEELQKESPLSCAHCGGSLYYHKELNRLLCRSWLEAPRRPEDMARDYRRTRDAFAVHHLTDEEIAQQVADVCWVAEIEK